MIYNDTNTDIIAFSTTVSATYNASTGEICADGINNDLAKSMCREFSLQLLHQSFMQTPPFNGEQNYLVMFCILDCF